MCGTVKMKANVVEDLAKYLDVQCVAGQRLAAQLRSKNNCTPSGAQSPPRAPPKPSPSPSTTPPRTTPPPKTLSSSPSSSPSPRHSPAVPQYKAMPPRDQWSLMEEKEDRDTAKLPSHTIQLLHCTASVFYFESYS